MGIRIAILIGAAVILVLAASFVRSRLDGDDPGALPAIAAQASASTNSRPEQRVESAAPQPTLDSANSALATASRPLPDPVDVLAQFALRPGQSPAQRAAALTEDEGHRLCSALGEIRKRQEDALRAAEPLDAAWAHPMQQKLREFFARQPEASQVEIREIECKSRSCEILAHGFTPDAQAAFTRLIEKARDPSWNDFSGMEYARTSETVESYHGRLIRIDHSSETRTLVLDATSIDPPESQAEAICVAWGNLREQRKREARENEAKDTGWAHPMEQLLRQYISSQVGRAAPDRLDIDCRTTFCTIRASGRTENSMLAFQRASQQAAVEPWSDLQSTTHSSSGYGEEWRAESILLRRASR